MNNYANGSTSGQAAGQEDLPLTKSSNGCSTRHGKGYRQWATPKAVTAAAPAAVAAGHSYKLLVCTICQALKPHGRPRQAKQQATAVDQNMTINVKRASSAQLS